MTEDQLRALGPVSDIVAPSSLHAAGVQRAKKVFPSAKTWGGSTTREAKKDVPWTDLLTEESWPFESELAMITLRGTGKIDERVFFHRQSRTLIVTDLAFNIANPSGLGAWLILHMFGTYKKFAVSRFFCRFIDDKTAFRESISRVLAWDFENIAMGHGDLVEGNGKALLQSALKERDLLP
jgi:hypothetical protein